MGSNVQSLMTDPRFVGLDMPSQKAVLAGVDSRFGGLSDQDFQTFKSNFGQPTTAAPMSKPPLPAGLQGPKDPGFGSALWKTVTSGSPLNPMNWPSMVKSAFESPFSDQNTAEAQKLNDVMAGRQEVPPVTPGQLGQGVGDLVNAGLTYGVTKGISALPESTPAVVKGAVRGAAKGATEMTPVTLRGHTFNVPSVLVSGAVGEGLGHYVPFARAVPHLPDIGGVAGAVAPIVRGAVRGGTEALSDFRLLQDIRNRPQPVYSAPSTPGLSNVPAQPASFFDPVDTNALPDAPPNLPQAWQIPNKSYRLPGPPPTPVKPSTPGLSNVVPAGFGPSPMNALPEVETGGGHIPDYVHPGPSPEEVAAKIAASKPASRLPDAKLLDDIARSQAGKTYAKLKPAEQATVRNIAQTVLAKPFISPLETTVMEQSPAIQPVAGGSAPAGNNIVYPEGIHPQLHPAGPEVAITHATNASAKDMAVAARLAEAGITLPAFDSMTDAELNQHYKALGYKALGSDYAPGKRVGRSAEVGRAHLRQVLSELK